jgi:ADP-ribosylglycohydrolase
MVHRISNSKYSDAVINSALWAAAGDALGWITELTSEDGLAARAGKRHITEPVSWKRIIGGRFGTRIDLPKGTYSDDTQLRLAVCRAIRGNGVFDPEAFAKVELTVWTCYALGAGRGTKAAASNLSRRDVNWFSNFFATKEQDYLHGGGNGAAMRIQPHVWVASRSNGNGYLKEVLRDALITHGHPQGFVGAIFHASCLAETLKQQAIAPLKHWYKFVEQFNDLPEILSEDEQLSAFWRPAWENAAGVGFKEAMKATRDDALRDMDAIAPLLQSDDPENYPKILEELGCLNDRFRGAGLKTAVAAISLAWLHRNLAPEVGLVKASNILKSDTDTIATMAGALRGAIETQAPNWEIQDRDYIEEEARRLADISGGLARDGFAYPDLALWSPPTSQLEAVGRLGEGLGVSGLGEAMPLSKEYSEGDAVRQWLKLSFGQTILAKRRKSLRIVISSEQLPGKRRQHRDVQPSQRLDAIEDRQTKLQFNETIVRNMEQKNRPPQNSPQINATNNHLDRFTDEVIASNFDDLTLGKMLNACIDQINTIEGAIAFSAIVAKAKLARRKRRSS